MTNECKKCACNANEIMVFPCSGGSNCGQIANKVAVDMTEDGVCAMYCLAGIGANIPSMIESAKAAKHVVAIDGCSIGCAKKILEHAGLTVTDYIDLAKEGLIKNTNFNLSQQEVFFITKVIKQKLNKEK